TRLDNVESKIGNPPCGGVGGWVGVSLDFKSSRTRCLKTNFGTSVNDLPKILDWDEWNANQFLGQMA
ncbi:hypothetical protein AVEN_152227-1, partial [Araneus ventricosus]